MPAPIYNMVGDEFVFNFHDTIQSSEEGFKDFLGEIIPNICSEIASEALNNKDYKPGFLTRLENVAKEKTKVFTEQEGEKTFAFLREFFKEYQDVAKNLGLDLPQFLREGIEAVKSTYTTVSKTMREAQQQLHKTEEQKNLFIQKEQVQQHERAPVYERGRAGSWIEKITKEEQQSNKPRSKSLN